VRWSLQNGDGRVNRRRALVFLAMLGDPVGMQEKRSGRNTITPRRHGVARVISKLGLGSRTQAAEWIAQGRVRVNGRPVSDPEFPVREGVDRVEVEGVRAEREARRVLMLNKPRGLVTTRSDERGRETVYSCLADANLPWLAPVGRLDKASEGLLLFSNDPQWAASITSPDTGPDKTYHVQIDCVPEPSLADALRAGVHVDGERLAAKSATVLRQGQRHAWLEIVLDEGRNRQIRRLLQAFDIGVLRLVRVGIGRVQLGELAKGAWRDLTPGEIASLSLE
jgi:23S rRNA pseudouridine2605 synthase